MYARAYTSTHTHSPLLVLFLWLNLDWYTAFPTDQYLSGIQRPIHRQYQDFWADILGSWVSTVWTSEDTHFAALKV